MTVADALNDAARDAARSIEEQSVSPTLLLCGKTGAGKSSLLNALVGAALSETGVTPTTKEPIEAKLSSNGVTLRALDVSGIGEAGRHDECTAALQRHLRDAHVLLVVAGMPDRAFSHELSLLDAVVAPAQAEGSALPLVIAASKIDLAPPRGEWPSPPATISLITPTTAKELAISRWAAYVEQSFARYKPVAVVPCAAGEAWNDRGRQHGLGQLAAALFDALPDAARSFFVRLVRDGELLERRANEIIYQSALLAAAAALQPNPAIPDATVIVPIQVSLIMRLASLHGANPREVDAAKLLGPVFTTSMGRLVAAQLAKLIPAFGSVVSAGVAGMVTLSLGQAYHHLMSRGVWAPTKSEIDEAFRATWNVNRSMNLEKLRSQASVALGRVGR